MLIDLKRREKSETESETELKIMKKRESLKLVPFLNRR